MEITQALPNYYLVIVTNNNWYIGNCFLTNSTYNFFQTLTVLIQQQQEVKKIVLLFLLFIIKNVYYTIHKVSIWEERKRKSCKFLLHFTWICGQKMRILYLCSMYCITELHPEEIRSCFSSQIFSITAIAQTSRSIYLHFHRYK